MHKQKNYTQHNITLMKKLILLSTLLCALSSFAQTSIKMKTGKETGSTFTFTVNSGLECYIDWGDGKNDTIISTTQPIEGTVAGRYITLKTVGLTYLDCSDQEISQLTFAAASTLEHLIVSNNKLITMSIPALVNLKTLWCDNNLLTNLDLSKQTELESLVASNNLISKITFPTGGLTKLTDCWLDHNRFSTLNLTGSKNITTLNIEDNTIKQLTLSQLETKAQAVFLANNSLDFTSLWNKANSSRWYGTEQNIAFASNTYNINEEFTLNRDFFGENQDGVTQAPSSYTFTWYQYDDNGVKGAKLTKGTTGNTTTDYTTPSESDKKNLFTFNKPFKDVQLEVKNNKYFSFLLLSDHIAIIDPTGIADITNGKDFNLTIGNGEITLSADIPTEVVVYNTLGVMVWRGEISQPTRIPLTKGTYIVNNKKISIN